MRRILTGAVCAALCAGTVVVAGTAPALAATSAAAKKVPVLVVKQSAKKVATGGSVTFTPVLHLPAHDKLASWALTFGDGSKTGAKAKALPHSVKHAYKKKLSGHAVLTVTDTKKHHWTVSLPISVVTLTFGGGGAAAVGVTTPAAGAGSTTTTGTAAGTVTDPGAIVPPGTQTTAPTPPSPYCAFPSTASYSGALTGRVTSAGNPVAGITVSVVDGVNSNLPPVAVMKTDAQGNWTLPAGTAAPGQYGYDIKINNDSRVDPDAPANINYDVRQYSCIPATNYKMTSELPPTVTVTGTVSSLDGWTLTSIGAVSPDGTGITTFGTVSGGQYTLHLAVGLTWTIFDSTGHSPLQGTLAVTATTTTGPTIYV